MAVELSALIHNTRLELSDIPEDHAGDEIIYQSITQAEAYVGKIVDITDVADSYLSHCYVCLAAYYVYLNYTSVAEQRDLDAVTMSIRLADLKNKARIFINQISEFDLDDNLNVSLRSLFVTPLSTGLTTSVDD